MLFSKAKTPKISARFARRVAQNPEISPIRLGGFKKCTCGAIRPGGFQRGVLFRTPWKRRRIKDLCEEKLGKALPLLHTRIPHTYVVSAQPVGAMQNVDNRGGGGDLYLVKSKGGRLHKTFSVLRLLHVLVVQEILSSDHVLSLPLRGVSQRANCWKGIPHEITGLGCFLYPCVQKKLWPPWTPWRRMINGFNTMFLNIIQTGAQKFKCLLLNTQSHKCFSFQCWIFQRWVTIRCFKYGLTKTVTQTCICPGTVQWHLLAQTSCWYDASEVLRPAAGSGSGHTRGCLPLQPGPTRSYLATFVIV